MSIIYEPKGRAREYASLAANLYSGCHHGCLYCYAPSAIRRKREDFHKNIKQRNNIIKNFEIDCKKIKTGRVLLSFTTDAYQPIDRKLEITRKAILKIKENNLNFEILTKGGMFASRDFDLYEKGDCFASTLTFVDKNDSYKWEPNAAEPDSRFEAIRLAKSMNIETWASLEPVIDPEQSLDIIKKMHKHVDLFKVGMLNHFKQDIDWKKFANEAVNLLKKLGCRYYIKNDLRKFL